MRFLKDNLTRLLCAFVFTLLLSTPLLTAAETLTGNYDYSRPASSHNVTLTSDALLSEYLGHELSAAEKNYLKKFGDISVTYNDGITTDKIVREYSDGTLTVTAYEYSYTAKNSVTLTWRPVSVRVGNTEEPLLRVGEGYTAVLYEIPEDETLSSLVTYTLSLTVSRESIASLVSRAYYDAPVWESTISEGEREYGEKLEKYNSDLLEYRAYLTALEKYNTDTAIYRDYLIRKKLYDEALEEYNDYLAALSRYESDLAVYNSYSDALAAYNTAYAEYLSYLSALAEYNTKLAEYNEKSAVLAVARGQLSFIDTAKVRMTMSRDIYSAIMGNLVTEVLVGNKDLLTSPAIGAKPEVIELAGTSTENLRILLPTYFSLESEEERYAYYSANFTQFRDNFKALAQALDELYRNRAIRNELKAQDRDEKYAILVAQLSLIAGALSGGDIDSYNGKDKLGGSYKIDYNGTKRTFAEILEKKTYIDTSIDPIPLKDGFPVLGAAPVPPTVKTEPKAPEAVSPPVKPTEVANPGTAPDVIEEPRLPIDVSEPTPPTEYIPPIEAKELIAAYSRGELEERAVPTDDFTFTVYKTVAKRLFGVSEVAVVFHGTSGEVLETVSVDSGTGVEFSGAPPTRAEDDRAVYTFGGWMTSYGELVSLSEVNTDLDLFPYFFEDIKSYNITFTVDGESYVRSFPYGTLPTLEFTPTRPDTDTYRYAFSGWNTEPVPVVGSASYDAVFTRGYVVPVSSSGVTVTETDDNYIVNARGVGNEKIDLTYLIEKALTPRTVRGISIDTASGKLTLPYLTVLGMHSSGDTLLSVDTVQLGAYGHSYKINVYNRSGDASAAEYKISARMVSGLTPSQSNAMYYYIGTERVGVSYLQEGALVSFSALSGVEYLLMREYTVNSVTVDNATITVSSPRTHAGAAVLVTVTLTEGYRMTALRVIDKNGVEIPVAGGVFIMPNSEVTVAAEVAAIEYTVTFMDGTRVISTKTYKHGETPTEPPAPSKLGEGYYLYTFEGWTSEISPVTADTVYYAVYKVTPLPEPQEPSGIQISEGILQLIVAAGIAATMLVLVVIPSFIVNICMYIRYRRGKAKKQR